MRSAAQIVSYEIPAVMILLVPVMIVGSLSLQDITRAQAGGLQNWFLFRYFPLMPVAFVVFFTAGLAEMNRAPFDIPEAESELVAGFHTEYSGFFFAHVLPGRVHRDVRGLGRRLACCSSAATSRRTRRLQQLGPAAAGLVLAVAKAWFLVFVMMWLRWTLPRARVDQLMYIAWKVLLPIALGLVVVVGGLVAVAATAQRLPVGPLRRLAAHARPRSASSSSSWSARSRWNRRRAHGARRPRRSVSR